MESISSNSNKKYFLALGSAAVATLLFAIKNICQRTPLAELKSFAGIKKHSLVILEATAGLTGLVAAALGLRGKSKTETKDSLDVFEVTNIEANDAERQKRRELDNKFVLGTTLVAASIGQEEVSQVEEEKIEAIKAYNPKRHLLKDINTWDADAIAYLTEFAASDRDAEYKLGCAFYKGCGVAQDKAIAISYWEKAAEKGDVDAQYQLGMYYMATGVNEDTAKGTTFMEKAYNGRSKKAKDKIALCYYTLGKQEIAKEDKQKGYAYLVKATKVASDSDNQAQLLATKYLVVAFDKLTTEAYPLEKRKVSDTAVKEIKTMATCGYVEAMLQTGVNQLMGYGCNQQKEAGKAWIEKYMLATNKNMTEIKNVITPNVAIGSGKEELMYVNTKKSMPLPWEIDHHDVLTAIDNAFEEK